MGAIQPRTVAGRGSGGERGGQGKPDEGEPLVSTPPTLPRGAGEHHDNKEHANFREEETKRWLSFICRLVNEQHLVQDSQL